MVRTALLSGLLCAVTGLVLADDTTTLDCTGVNAIGMRCPSRETPYRRDFFYVGERTIVAGPNNTVVADQLYVEKLTPASGQVTRASPLVFFHGGGTSAVTWLNTPDNRRGWAAYFVEKGFAVYLVDATSVGRSSNNDLAGFAPMGVGSNVEQVEKAFSAPQVENWYPQASLHTQWPGTGLRGDPTLDQFKRAMIPLSYNFSAQELVMRRTGCELLGLLGAPAFLVSHSLGSVAPVLLSNDCPDLVAGHVSLEGAISPFWGYDWGLGGFEGKPWGMSNTPVDYDPPVSDAAALEKEFVGEETMEKRNCRLLKEPAPKLPKIASVPFVMVTGEASVHATYDHCAVEFLRQVGGQPEWIQLGERGIKGNGHFMFMEKNSDDIAEVVLEWMEKTDGAAAKARRSRVWR